MIKIGIRSDPSSILLCKYIQKNKNNWVSRFGQAHCYTKQQKTIVLLLFKRFLSFSFFVTSFPLTFSYCFIVYFKDVTSPHRRN